MDRNELMESFIKNLGKKFKKARPGFTWIKLEDGQSVEVELTDPRYVNRPKEAGNPSSRTGFAKGEVTHQNLDN